MLSSPGKKVNVNKRKSFIQLHLEREAGQFLEILSLCQELQILPRAGGLYDQDSLFVDLMKNALANQAERRQLDEQKMKIKSKRK